MSSASSDRSNLLRTRVRRFALAVGTLASAIGLSACGGGDQAQTFDPSRIVAFGDEASVLETFDYGADGTLSGQKYSVNYLEIYKGFDSDFNVIDILPDGATLALSQPTWVDYPDAAVEVADSFIARSAYKLERQFNLSVAYLDSSDAAQTLTTAVTYQYAYLCTENRLWIQLLADAYGLGFRGQCAVDGGDNAVSYAEGGATVDDVSAQVDEALADGALNDTTLVTVLAGQNDILQAYADVMGSALSLDAAKAAMKSKGQQLGRVVNRIVDRSGARVLIVTVPDLGLSPRARAAGSVGMSNMTALVVAFNDGLIGSGGVRNDGNFIGRVKGYEEIQNMAENPSDYGLTNADTAACEFGRDPQTGARVESSDPDYGLYCSNFTLRSGAGAFSYLWATDVLLSPIGHSTLGNLAYVRARDNPF